MERRLNRDLCTRISTSLSPRRSRIPLSPSPLYVTRNHCLHVVIFDRISLLSLHDHACLVLLQDWVDEKTIADPSDSKPADWDVPEHIADPDAKKPDDWDDEMDGGINHPPQCTQLALSFT
jgi:hypothetical protein